MSRAIWFVAGAGAGVYAMTRARRAAEVFTPEGWSDRLSSLNLGVQVFTEEYRSARDERAAELRHQLGLAADGPLALARTKPPATEPPTERPKELN